MKIKRIYLKQVIITSMVVLIVFFTLRAYLLRPPADNVLANGAHLEWNKCSFDIPLTEIIHCATLYPSLQNKQRNASIPIVVVKNISPGRQADPVLYINGGPGAATGFKGGDIKYWLDQINELKWNRDFVLYDQRGTGQSRPEILCPSFNSFFYDVLTTDLSLEETMQHVYLHHKECHSRVKEYDGDLSGYSTKYNTQDVIDITQALDYQQWNLYGVSYGTRVSLEVMRTNPNRIRSVILDSVFPSDKHDLLTWPAILDNAIESIFKRCENDKTCESRYPDLRERFKHALTNLKHQSMLVNMPNYYSDGALEIYMDDSRFIDALFFAMYDSDLMSLIPDTINDVMHGRQNNLIPIMTYYANMVFDEYSNIITFNSVICNDEYAASRQDYEAEVNKYPGVKWYTAGMWEYDICTIWRANNKNVLNATPVTSSIPTLVLAGRDDNVTPWQWGKEVHENLDNSFYFVYPNTTHGVVGLNKCATRMTTTFLNKLQVTEQDSCI